MIAPVVSGPSRGALLRLCATSGLLAALATATRSPALLDHCGAPRTREAWPWHEDC